MPRKTPTPPPDPMAATYYRMDDKTLEITPLPFAEAARQILGSGGDAAANRTDDLMNEGLICGEGFEGYYHRDEAALKDVKADIEELHAYVQRQADAKKPCYLSEAQALTELPLAVIAHVLNVRRRFAPV